MDFQTFHKYRHLASVGKVKPLTCPLCEGVYVLRATEDGDPVLQCFPCGTRTQPGLRLWENVQAVVKEHYA